MNKKVLISLGVIGVLLLYIVISKIDFSSNPIDLKDWDGKATEISIKKDKDSIQLVKKDGRWLINKEEYPANTSLISNMEKKLAELEIDSLVSEKKFYSKYDLTPDKSYQIVAKKKEDIVRQLIVGKKGSTNKHTYVRVNNMPQVFLAKGTFDNPFNKSIDELRDKEVFKVDKKAINGFEIKYRGRLFSFSKKIEEKIIDKNKKEGTIKDNKNDDKKKETKKVETWVCKQFAGVELNKNKIESFLSPFGPLRANSFPDAKKETLGYPLSSVKIKAYGKELTLDIYNKKEEKNYFAVSSESPFVFTINEWTAKKFFMENINDFKQKK